MLVVMIFTGCLIYHTGLTEWLTDIQSLQQFILRTGYAGYLLYLFLFIICAVCLAPGSVLVIAGAVAFGPWLGALLSLIAATISSSLSFLIARLIGREWIVSRFGHHDIFQKIEAGIENYGIDFLILTRLVPLFPYNIQSYAYGLTSMPFWPFTLISALTMLPGLLLYSFMAGELVTQGLNQIFMFELFGAGLLLFLLIQAGKYYARRKHINWQ